MYSDFMDIVNELESQFPVSTWKINGIHIWPIFRFNLFFLNASLRQSKTKSRSQRKTFNAKSALIVSTLNGLIRDLQVARLDKSKNDRIRDADFVFLSQTNNRNSKIDSYWYDRGADPYIAVANEIDISSLLLECSPSHEYRTPRYSQSVLIQKDINFCKIKSKLYSKQEISKKITSLDEFKLFRDCLENGRLKRFPNNQQLSYQLISIQNMSSYFIEILREVKPVAGFSVPYYWDIAMAFNLACKQLNIPSIDIQHGLQNESHVAYARWGTVPGEGYELLPSYFLCWSDFEVQLINRWRQGKTQNHQPIAIGNLGLELQLRENTKLAEVGIEPLSSLIQKDKGLAEPAINILFTLQPIEDPLPDWIIESIQQSPRWWKWWMRLHPAMLAQYDLFNELLHKHHVEHVNLKQASELPLPWLLVHTDVHVTQLSSVVLEAERCNVPSVMTDVRAAQVFPEQTRSEVAIIATRSESLIDAIARQFLKRKQQNPSKDQSKAAVIDNAKKVLLRFKECNS